MAKKLVEVPNRPKWLYRSEGVDKRGNKVSRYAVREQNELFEVSGKKRRFELLPDWITSPKEAEIEGEKVRKVWMTKPDVVTVQPKALLTFAEVVQAYLADRKPEWRQRSYDEAKWVLEKKLTPWFSEHCPHIGDFTKSVAWKFLDSLREANPDGKRFSAWKRVTAIANYALEKGYITEKIDIDIADVDPDDEAGRCLTPRESARLEAKSRKNPVMHLIFLLGRYTGMRRREIETLEKSAIDLAGQSIKLKGAGTKTKKGREVPIPDRVMPALRRQIAAAEGRFVFPGRDDATKPITTFKFAWQNLRKSARVNCRFQDLRVTSITTMCLAGVDSSIVAMIHGNTPQTIRDKYLKPSQADLLRLMNRTIQIGFMEI